jgi:hypothetical protein
MIGEDEVRSRLSALPHPAMPPDVEQALTDRLAGLVQQSAQQPAPVVAITPAHRSRLNAGLLVAAVAAFAMLISLTVQSPGPPVAATVNPVIKAGAIYSQAGFAEQLRERFAGAPAATTPTNTFADSAQGIVDCTTAVAAYGRLLSIDTGSYDDTQAAVLITAYPLNTDYEEVWVVTPGCGSEDTLVMGHMVLDVDDSAATAAEAN